LTVSKNIHTLLPWLILIIALVFYQNLLKEALCFSPSFTRQQIMNNYRNVINASSEKIVKDDKIAMASVNYLSDGKYFNASMWLLNRLYKKLLPTNVTYGMLIDADNNNNTGMQGADYGIKIQWNGENKTWERVFEEYETPNPLLGISERRTVEVSPIKNFYEDKKRYVTMYADLQKLDFPQQYRVIFFAEDHNGPKSNVSFTNWVNIPPPQLNMSVSQNPILVSPGEQVTLELQLKSTQGIEARVHLYTVSQSNGITISFDPNNLTIPSFGMTTTHIQVQIPAYIAAGQQITLPVLATLNIPPKSFVQGNPQAINLNSFSNTDLFHIPANVTNQKVFTQYSITIRTFGFQERLVNFFTGIFTPITSIITTLTTIVSGLVAYLVALRRRQSSSDRKA
jgi:hypothetical protein